MQVAAASTGDTFETSMGKAGKSVDSVTAALQRMNAVPTRAPGPPAPPVGAPIGGNLGTPNETTQRGEYGAGCPDGKTPGTDKLEHRRSDGAAVGQFTNVLPIDKAVDVMQSGANSYGAGTSSF